MKKLVGFLFAGLVTFMAVPSQASFLSAAERAAALAIEERAAARAAAAAERAAAEERAAARSIRRGEDSNNWNFEFKPKPHRLPQRPEAKCDDDNDNNCK
jgi:hypothetical protein